MQIMIHSSTLRLRLAIDGTCGQSQRRCFANCGGQHEAALRKAALPKRCVTRTYNFNNVTSAVSLSLFLVSLPIISSCLAALHQIEVKAVLDYDTLKTLGKTGIEVMVGIPNDMLAIVGGSMKAAEKWVAKNVTQHITSNNVNIRSAFSFFFTSYHHLA
ncbi:hypothetical protein GOBAR_AA21808 [Gossypium barbadense]|uniref:Glucan endo-1,3-beta-D-glucosidase n=1 Tax=Gossypium barbadense TaxID=3634 RepID=A0A2P5X694_GOSBA|nr:hypothetical protein GOBAR_AA21808 [Gossypium barbadense]